MDAGATQKGRFILRAVFIIETAGGRGEGEVRDAGARDGGRGAAIAFRLLYNRECK